MDVFGRGFLFPIAVDPESGRLATVEDTAVIAQSLRMLLKTAPGERLMVPSYGCDLRRYLFAPNTVTTRRLIAEEVTRAVELFEDRVSLLGVDVTADDLEPAQVNILLRYTQRRTGNAATLTSSFRLDGTRS